MKNKLFIEESEKSRILEMHREAITKNILNEELPVSPPSSANTNKNANAMKKRKVLININPKNLKIGDGGTKKPKLKNDVIALQQKLIEFGCLTTDTGKPTGYFGNKTNTSLIKYNQQGPCNKVVTDNKPIINKPKDESKGSFTSYFRKYFPNMTQMFFTRNLSTSDFTENQKKVLFNTILNAIKRGVNPNFGSTEYDDYGKDIKDELDTKKGASTFRTLTGSILPDDRFKMATTVGRFSFKKNNEGNYIVTDNYDFTKGTDYDKINSGELKDKSYLEKMSYVMSKNNWSMYRSARFLAWLEHPQSSTDKDKIKIYVELNPEQLASITQVSKDSGIA